MKPILLICPKLPANGMAIFPFILVKSKLLESNRTLINHERIHHKQQLELLILPFYIFYFFHYVINLIIYKDHYKAYINIIFEKEAYIHEENLDYLKTRKLFSWIALLTRK